MLPIVPGGTKVNSQGIPVYQFADPDSVDFVYNFDPSVQATPYNGTNGNGMGYFGSNQIASPQYICNSVNRNNAFSGDFPNWLSTINAQIDLRAFYVKCGYDSITKQNTFIRLVPDMPEVLGTSSSYTGAPVAYTTEALYYAQSGYFVTVVMVQWSNVFACKSRKVIFYFILVFFDLFRSQQTHVRWYCLRNCFVHRLALCSRYQRSLRW